MTKHTLPKLPYEYDALEPVISKEIMELHHSKHHNAYVTKLNEALEAHDDAVKNDDVDKMIELQSAIKFNGGGHINHSLFWDNLAPEGNGGGGEPSGMLKELIDKHWGNFANFQQEFNTKTAAVQGSGWGWLVYYPKTDDVMIWVAHNQDPVPSKYFVPLMGVDVWEHAYYLQYKNARPEYLKNIWRVINWKCAEERLEKAKG